MKRTAVAAAWILGSTLPLLAATVFLFGCCVLPFHQVMHRLMPICELAMNVMRGDDGADRDATPARQKEEPVKRIATSMPQTFRLTMSPATAAVLATASETALRSFVSLGAVRCDQDVGLHVLVETFRI
ncbi:MAG TPA: hypothetical protein VNA69_19415 [Thermoanaerobaculia bacterium]|nr:hypothetical protein [Thermoanaerobaculia bacterium]